MEVIIIPCDRIPCNNIIVRISRSSGGRGSSKWTTGMPCWDEYLLNSSVMPARIGILYILELLVTSAGLFSKTTPHIHVPGCKPTGQIDMSWSWTTSSNRVCASEHPRINPIYNKDTSSRPYLLLYGRTKI